jgi:hypothetical protein
LRAREDAEIEADLPTGRMRFVIVRVSYAAFDELRKCFCRFP